MNRIGTTVAIMIFGINGRLITAIGFFGCGVPFDITLAIYIAPDWN